METHLFPTNYERTQNAYHFVTFMYFNAYDEEYLPTHILNSVDPSSIRSLHTLLSPEFSSTCFFRPPAERPNFYISFGVDKSKTPYDPNILNDEILDW